MIGFRYPSLLRRLAPFLRWLPELRDAKILRADAIAGVTVALVLVPQSMAYAQLAGLPAYYGLYAAFLPPIVAALFGSSRQLATGPVAVVSLLTAAALAPLAGPGTGAYVAYAILLALIVGLFQLLLGLLRLGVLVNFLSHPVVLGFTNAAAIIIATSQLSKIFGVTADKAAHYYETVWNVLVAAVSYTHWPTVGIAVLAFTIMITLRRLRPRLPGVLVAVLVTTLIAWATGFEKVLIMTPEHFANETVRALVTDQLSLNEEIKTFEAEIGDAQRRFAELSGRYGADDARTLVALHALDSLRLRLGRRVESAAADLNELRTVHFEHVPGVAGEIGEFYIVGHVPAGTKTDGAIWRLTRIQPDGKVRVRAGGQVVGAIPGGLPSFRPPRLDLQALGQLFLSAVAIALIGFVEAISVAKAMAARTRHRLDANQELIGQGLSNIVGSLFQSYAVSGSFSRSAVNIGAGAMTGFSSVVSGLVVVATLLWATPLLYYLPQATLAAVIMMAVIGLVNFRAMRHTWRVQREDGAVAMVTFVLTLVFAPHLDRAIMIGVILSLIIFLYRTMEPRVVVLSRHPDGTLRDAELYGLKVCENITVIRFDGSLYFANTGYFEDKVMEKVASKPRLSYIIVDGEGINQIDATGEEMLSSLTERLGKAGVQVLFARMKKQVMDVFKNAGFVDRIGQECFFRRTELALDYAWERLGNEHEVDCPLNIVCPIKEPD